MNAQLLDYPHLANAIARGTRVSVVIPARNEEATIAHVISAIRHPALEIVVIASGDDHTAEVATRAGADIVHRVEHIRNDIPARPGKGDAMWRGVHVATGEVIVFMDADLTSEDIGHIPFALANTLLSDPNAVMTKGYYASGGRVSELTARPLLNLLYPESLELIQPLGGEYAVTRDFIRAVTFPIHYAIEVSLLLYAYEWGHLVNQVDLGVKQHEQQPVTALSKMAIQITHEILSRTGVMGLTPILRQFIDGEPSDYDFTALTEHLPAVDGESELSIGEDVG